MSRTGKLILQHSSSNILYRIYLHDMYSLHVIQSVHVNPIISSHWQLSFSGVNVFNVKCLFCSKWSTLCYTFINEHLWFFRPRRTESQPSEDSSLASVHIYPCLVRTHFRRKLIAINQKYTSKILDDTIIHIVSQIALKYNMSLLCCWIILLCLYI